MPATTLAPRPPIHHRAILILSASACIASSIACAPLPPEAGHLALASGSAIDTLRAEHAALIRTVTDIRRAEVDANFPSIYAEAEAAVRARHNLAPHDPLSLDHRLDAVAIAIGVRDELLLTVSTTEANLLNRADLHHAHARRLTDALSAYLLARTSAEELRANLANAAARRVGIDPEALSQSIDRSIADALTPTNP